MRFLGAGILALVVALSAVPAAVRQATDADVDKIVQAFMAAYNKADAATLASFYTADATRVTPDGGVHAGKAAIQKSFAERDNQDHDVAGHADQSGRADRGRHVGNDGRSQRAQQWQVHQHGGAARRYVEDRG